MKQRLAFIAVCVAPFALLGCPKKDEETSKPAPAVSATAPVVASAAPSAIAKPKHPDAVNAADVKHFADEQKVADVETSLDWDNANVRRAPQGGSVVAVLKKGTPVTQVGRRQYFYLITFDDPKKPGQRLEGWVFQDAFKKSDIPAAAATHGGSCYDNAAGFCDAPELRCPAGQKHFEFEGDYCAKPCTTDAECAPGGNCSPEDHALIEHGKPVGRAHHCFYENGSTDPPKTAPSASASGSPSAAPSTSASAKSGDPETCPKGQKTGPRGYCYKVCTSKNECPKDFDCQEGALFDLAAKLCLP